jgi:7-dehydrocholesterol reductase
MWGNKGKSQGLYGSGAFREMLGPVLIIAGTNVFISLLLAAMGPADWDLSLLVKSILADPAYLFTGLKMPGAMAVKILLSYAAFELLLMRVVPGKTYKGPVTPAGNVPVYTANGFQCFIITLVTYLVSVYGLHLWNPSVVIDHYAECLTALTLFSFGLCTFLYVKGLYFPSSTDCGSNGNVFMDFYWGTELYPRVLGWDVKMFTNCRFGMMAWVLMPLVCAHKSIELNGALTPAMAVNVALQLIYCAKVRRGRGW